MTIYSSLTAGVAGLLTNAHRLGSISDNIANSSTQGYKRADTDFHSLVNKGLGGEYSAGGVRATTQRLVGENGAYTNTKNARIEEKGYFDGTSIRLTVNPDKGATSATLIVKNADGKEVAKEKIELPSKTIDWSGKGTDGKVLDAGVYSFSVESFKDGKSIGVNYAEAYSEITEVTFADKKTLLTLAGDQTVLLDKIKGLRENS